MTGQEREHVGALIDEYIYLEYHIDEDPASGRRSAIFDELSRTVSKEFAVQMNVKVCRAAAESRQKAAYQAADQWLLEIEHREKSETLCLEDTPGWDSDFVFRVFDVLRFKSMSSMRAQSFGFSQDVVYKALLAVFFYGFQQGQKVMEGKDGAAI